MMQRNSPCERSGSRLSAGGSRQPHRQTLGRGAWQRARRPSCVSRMKDGMIEMDLDQLRAELDEFAQPEKRAGRSAREERIIAGFEDIQRFVREHGRLPQHGEDRDIFERLYAVRLDRLRAMDECRSLLVPLDHHGLLAESGSHTTDAISTDELRSALEGAAGSSDITTLQHVRPSAEKAAAEEIASRIPCVNF